MHSSGEECYNEKRQILMNRSEFKVGREGGDTSVDQLKTCGSVKRNKSSGIHVWLMEHNYNNMLWTRLMTMSQ